MDASPPKTLLNGESRGSTQANDATVSHADMALPGIDTADKHLINNSKAGNGCGHEGKSQKLAEHTLV